MDSSLPHTEFKYADIYISFREEITMCSAPDLLWGKRNATQKAHKKGRRNLEGKNAPSFSKVLFSKCVSHEMIVLVILMTIVRIIRAIVKIITLNSFQT